MHTLFPPLLSVADNETVRACLQDHVYGQSGVILYSTLYGYSCSLSIHSKDNQPAVMILRVPRRIWGNFRISNETSTEVFSTLRPDSVLKCKSTDLSLKEAILFLVRVSVGKIRKP